MTENNLFTKFLQEKKLDSYNNTKYQQEFLPVDNMIGEGRSELICELCKRIICNKPKMNDFEMLFHRHIRKCTEITSRVEGINEDIVYQKYMQEFQQWKKEQGVWNGDTPEQPPKLSFPPNLSVEK